MWFWYLLAGLFAAAVVYKIVVAVLDKTNIGTTIRELINREKPALKTNTLQAIIKSIDSEQGIHKVSIDILNETGTKQCEVEVQANEVHVSKAEKYAIYA